MRFVEHFVIMEVRLWRASVVAWNVLDRGLFLHLLLLLVVIVVTL